MLSYVDEVAQRTLVHGEQKASRIRESSVIFNRPTGQERGEPPPIVTPRRVTQRGVKERDGIRGGAGEEKMR